MHWLPKIIEKNMGYLSNMFKKGSIECNQHVYEILFLFYLIFFSLILFSLSLVYNIYIFFNCT